MITELCIYQLVKLNITLFNTTFSKYSHLPKSKLLCIILSVTILPRSELTSFPPPQQVQSQRCRSLLLFARVWQGGRSGRNTTSWSHERLDIWKLLIFLGFADTYLLEHNFIISNRNQNSESYNQICASVSCSTAEDSSDRVKKEHVYWMTWEIMQGSCPEFCLNQCSELHISRLLSLDCRWST